MDENSVNAETVEPVIPQTDVQETSVDNSQVADVKPVQSSEENAKYADMRRKTETETKDKMIAEMYGTSHNIHTYADYQKAIASQKETEENAKFQEETGVDPDKMKPMFEQWKKSDPDFQELSNMRQEKNLSKELENLNSELKENGVDIQLKDLSSEEINKIPNVAKVTEYVTKGHSLADSFWLANKKDIMTKQAQAAQQDTIKKIAANGASSPGSLSGGESSVTYTMDQINAMSQSDINKNYGAVMASIKNMKRG
jgi:hypothetical protein